MDDIELCLYDLESFQTIWKVSGRSKKCPDHPENVAGLSKILQNHLLCAFVADLKIDAIYALYPKSFCNKNLANRKVFVFCDSGMEELIVELISVENVWCLWESWSFLHLSHRGMVGFGLRRNLGTAEKEHPSPLFPLQWSEMYWSSSSVKVIGSICLRSD